jgi:hypothetical protein
MPSGVAPGDSSRVRKSRCSPPSRGTVDDGLAVGETCPRNGAAPEGELLKCRQVSLNHRAWRCCPSADDDAQRDGYDDRRSRRGYREIASHDGGFATPTFVSADLDEEEGVAIIGANARSWAGEAASGFFSRQWRMIRSIARAAAVDRVEDLADLAENASSSPQSWRGEARWP